MNLDKKSLKILRCFVKTKSDLSLEQLTVLVPFDTKDILEHLVFLWQNNYIKVIADKQPEYLPMDGKFQITTQGKVFIELRTKSLILTWSPIIFSFIAIIISIIALFD